MFATKTKNQVTAGFRPSVGLTQRSLMALLVCAAPFWIFSSASEAGSEAKVERSGDGFATVTFQPIGASDSVTVYNIRGEEISTLNWKAEFKVSVTESALRKATTKTGIDIHALLKGVGTVSTGTMNLVSAKLPETAEPVVDRLGRVLLPGTQIYFGLSRLAKSGTVAPVVAVGDGASSMGPGGAANDFNDRLYEKGVTGSPGQAAKAKQVKAQAAPAHSHASNIHGDGYVANDSGVPESIQSVTNAALTAKGGQFLSSPTCVLRESESMIKKSYWGKRKSFRTDNGARASTWHDGVDIAGRAGTPVVAAGAGCVSVADMRFNARSGYGLSLKVDHGNGLVSQYSHMQNFSQAIRDFAKKAKKGDKYCLARGEQLGNVGQTGNCTGPHLHFGASFNGRSVNPLKFMIPQSDGDLSETCQVLAAKNDAYERSMGNGSPIVSAGAGMAAADSQASRAAIAQ